MFTKGYALSVKSEGEFLREKNIKHSGERQVFLSFNSEYSVYLKNKTNYKAKFQVKLDGKFTHPKDQFFVISPDSSFELERFMLDGDLNKGENFKFVDVEGSGEEPGLDENGLIEVTVYKATDKQKPSGIFRSCFSNSSGLHLSNLNSKIGSENAIKTSSMHGGYSGQSVGLDSFDSSNFSDSVNEESEEGVTVGGSESNQSFVDAPEFKVVKSPIILKINLKSVKHSAKNKVKCPACSGRGLQTNLENVDVLCPVCDGTGVKPEALTVGV